MMPLRLVRLLLSADRNSELQQSVDAASGFELLPTPFQQHFANIPELASFFQCKVLQVAPQVLANTVTDWRLPFPHLSPPTPRSMFNPRCVAPTKFGRRSAVALENSHPDFEQLASDTLVPFAARSTRKRWAVSLCKSRRLLMINRARNCEKCSRLCSPNRRPCRSRACAAVFVIPQYFFRKRTPKSAQAFNRDIGTSERKAHDSASSN